MMDNYLSTKLALIRLTVSEKTRFTDDGWTTDARATALALLTQSSRAKNWHKRPRRLDDLLGHWLDNRILVWYKKNPCPVAEWLERRAEEHICPRCACSKPARANVMICLNLSI